ncbi:MAG: hypothetical protein KDD34_07310 [Bdellovibrionales bacterium]|nr:hypothetical protein [Bdellovibrionales bacterium]
MYWTYASECESAIEDIRANKEVIYGRPAVVAACNSATLQRQLLRPDGKIFQLRNSYMRSASECAEEASRINSKY